MKNHLQQSKNQLKRRENVRQTYMDGHTKFRVNCVIQCLLYVRLSVYAIPSSGFVINLNSSHSSMKISSPNVQGVFMAITTCLKHVCKKVFDPSLENKMAAIADCLKNIKIL